MENKTNQDEIKHILSIKSHYKVEVKGLNQTRILNTLNTLGIALKKIDRLSGSVLQFSIQKKDYIKLKDTLDKFNYQHKIISESSIRSAFKKMQKNIGLIAGIIVFCALAIVSNSFIWSVKISGNQSIDKAVIQRSLKQSGIKQGTLKFKIDNDKIASTLRNMEGVAEAVAFVKGTTLFVSVYESQQYVPPIIQEPPADIVSAYDAQITKIAVLNGVSAKKIGDKVAKGSVLIKGEIVNTLGEPIEQCKARGYVYGRVAFTQTHIFSPIEEVVRYTNKTKVHTNLTIFGLTIGKKAPSQTQNWQSHTKTFNSFLLPIKFNRTTFYQTELTTQEIDINSYVEKLKDEAILNNVIKAGGSEIETVTTLTQIEGGLLRLNIYIQAEILISQE